MGQLTRREVQCLRLAGEGLSNKEIARRLGADTSPKTISNHLSNAYSKVGTSDRMKAAGIAALVYPDYSRNGPIPIDSPGPATSSDEASGVLDTFADAASRWPLPRPHSGLGVRLLIVAGFAAVSAIVVIGVVAIMWASISLTGELAPEHSTSSTIGESR